MRPRDLAAALAVAAVAASIPACGKPGQTIETQDLGLPSASASPMATRQVSTSPDGGIYRNPDAVEIVWVGNVDVSPVAARLGTASSWSALSPLGPLLGIGLRLHNDGKAGSTPTLDDLQVASDQAPAGTDSGPLRRFYHPTFPLAALSDVSLTGDCTVSLDPGQWATVVLLYPPTAAGELVVWGRYTEFALELHRGGGLGRLPDGLHAGTCTPPHPSGA